MFVKYESETSCLLSPLFELQFKMQRLPESTKRSGNPNEPDEKSGSDEETTVVTSQETRLNQLLKDCQSDYEKFSKNDQNLARKDTIEVCMDIMTRVQAIGTEINDQTEETRERMYYLTFNATIINFRICQQMRLAGYAKESTHFLAFNVLCLDNNLILTTVKYLDWRVLNYVELGRSYADIKAFKAALKVIGYGITKVLYSKKIEEQDPPVPEGTKETLVEALRVLRGQELKYQLQSGALNADAWKKRIQEVFSQNKYHRALAIVECLSMNDVNNCRIIDRSAIHLDLKTACLKTCLDMVMPDITLLKNALIQIHEKKKRDKSKKEVLLSRGEDVNIEQLLGTFKIQDQEMIKEKEWKFASYNCPVEVHIELLKLCYEAKLWFEFDELLDPALVRLKFRRYETPYLATIDVQMSSSKVSNIPNGFEKLNQDLNSANLRIELKKLRAAAKKSGHTADEEPEVKKKDGPKKEEKKAAPVAPAKGAPDAKKGGKEDPKKGAQAVVEPPPEEEDDIVATQKELDIINHVYVYMLLQRTKSPQNAIVGVEVTMADETIGPEIPASHFAVAIPIRQHPGAYQKTKLIPYLVFRRTANSLIDEEDTLSVVTDVQIIMGQDRHLRAPLGYTKIPIDLRQTPADLERVPNLDYVFVCYKTDKQLTLVERDLLIFRRVAELERSIAVKDTETFKALPEEHRFLMTNYSIDYLMELSRTMREALLGPIGDYYLESRRDILNDISLKLYSQYLLPVLQRIDIYVEMRNQKEYYGDFVDLLDQHAISMKAKFLDAFNVIHRILTRESFIENIILYSKFSIYYSNLLEENGDFRNSVQVLRASVQKVVEYREERMKSVVDSEDSVTTSMCITIDNRKIGELESKIQKITETWKELILRKERELERKEKEAESLDDQEGDEEQLEIRLCADELKDKDLFEKQIDAKQWHETTDKKNTLNGKKYFTEQDMLVNALHADLIVCLYRCEVKLGKESNAKRKQVDMTLTEAGIDLQKNAVGNMTKNLSADLTKKMTLGKSSKTLAKNKANLKDLQHTLQEAGKLAPPLPPQLSYEKILEIENNQNPYQQALLYMSLAVAKSNSVSQKSLLLESLEYIKKAKESEDQMSQIALDNAVAISAARRFHAYFNYSPDKVYPYSLLAKAIYIKKTPTPPTPIMIARSSTSITMKLPFYKPITEYKNWRNISEIALYGKPAGSGVSVSLNNTDYPGTGTKQAPGHIVQVTNLIQNEKYVFAAGGYTTEGICVNGIGETCKDVITLLPLSLHQINGYLAEIAFKLGHFQIARTAAENVCQAFITKNEFRYAYMDVRVNPVLAVRLNTEALNLVSVIEAKQVAEAFIIMSKVSKILKNEVQKRAETHELQLETQKMDLKIANYLVIALDIALILNRAVLIKRVVCELFNHLVTYFQMQLQSTLLLQILVKCHQSLREVPQEMIDSTCRRIIACLSFQILRLGFQTAEEPLLKRLMLSELPLNTRKWRKYSQYVMFHPSLPEDQQIAQKVQQAKIAAGEKIIDVDMIKSPDPYDEKQILLQEFEVEGGALEEFLLSLGDFSDIVRAKTERWKNLVAQFQRQLTHNDSVKQEQKKIGELADFWDGIKTNNPIVQLTNICAAVEASPRLLEFACKCIRRAMEMPEITVDQILDALQTKLKLTDNAEVLDLLKSRIVNLVDDVVLKQRTRFKQLEEKVKIMLEQKTLNGGNNQITAAQLKKILADTKDSVSSKVEDSSQQVVKFASDEEEEKQCYLLLWVSEKLYLQGICLFLQLTQEQGQRNVLALVNNPNCIFDDIIRLDFVKFKTAMTEYQDAFKLKKTVFEESVKGQLGEKKMDVEKRKVKMANILEVMSRAAVFALNSKSWLQLVSIILYVWNSFSYDLTNPLELTETEAWKPLTVLAECSLYLLEYLQKGGKLRKVINKDIDLVKNQKSAFSKAGLTVNFHIDESSEVDLNDHDKQANDVSTDITNKKEGDEEEKEPQSTKGIKWYDHVGEFDISIQASFIGFAVQCLMCVGKWESMVDISNRLNQATDNTFSMQLLPFIINAQTTLYQSAEHRTQDKKRTLESRIQQFENWKLTNKKKRSRTAMITGEIPPEEQEFLNDKVVLEKEIFRLEVIENVLLSDRDASNKLLENIKRDANNCDESLKACRKLYFQFGLETHSLREDELKKGCLNEEQIQNHEIKAKRKSYKVFTGMVISSYKKCIDLLRKRQEKFLLIQALHELGNLHFAEGNLQEAEVQWNDCVDTIFQRLYVVKEWRGLFKENPILADAFGSRQVLIGAIVLTKLAKLCYEGKDMQKFMETHLMAAELFAAPAKLSLPHPQPAIEYASYCFQEYFDGRLPGENQLFFDKQIIQPSELLHTLFVACQQQIDIENYNNVLPLAALMEYLALSIVKSNVLTLKARVTKAIALVELGYINEAYFIYKKILMQKDLPQHGKRPSESTSRADGVNFHLENDDCYNNDLTPEDPKNLPVITYIQKTIGEDVLAKLKVYSTPSIIEMLQYLRSMFLVRLGEQENVEVLDKAEQRKQMLKLAEESLRASLVQVSNAIQVLKLRHEIDNFKARNVNLKEAEIADLEKQLVKVFETGNISKKDQDVYFSNTEEEMCYADMNSQLMSHLLRVRASIGRLQRKQGFLLQSFYVLRQGLTNFKLYADGWIIDTENGQEEKNKGSFELPVMYGGSAPDAGVPVKGGKAPAPVAAKGKPAAPVKGAPPVDPNADEAFAKAEEEQKKKRLEQDREAERFKTEALSKRRHPHMLLWLKTKIEIISILFSQRRFEDCSDSIAIAKLECMAIKDQFYIRQLNELDFMMQVYDGQTQPALNKGRELRLHAQKYFQNDTKYAEFLGNLSELMYDLDKREEAIEIVKEGRLIAWYKLRDQGIEIDQQNLNQFKDVFIDQNRKELKDDALAGFQAQAAPTAGKGGKEVKAPPPKGKDPKGGVVEAEPEFIEEKVDEVILDFTKAVKYDLVAPGTQWNSTQVPMNIYLLSLPLAIRFDLRYAQYCIYIQHKSDLGKKILLDTQKLIKRALFVSPQMKFHNLYLLGQANQKIFQDLIIQFQNKYAHLKKYKKSLTSHIPFNSFALGEYLIELPGFSQELREKLLGFLNEAFDCYKKAISVAKNECPLYEFDFNLKHALEGLSEVNFYIGEYRQRVLDYKYANYIAEDKKRRMQNLKDKKREAGQPDDDINDAELKVTQDKWEEMKENKEALAIFNYKKASIHYLEMSNQVSKQQRLFLDSQHTLNVIQLTDPSKIPREVASEMFEASQVQKVVYAKLAGFEFKDKTTITSAEVLAYLKAVLYENRFFTFGQDKEKFSQLISKLHRYLKVALSSYMAQVATEVKDYVDVTDVKVADVSKLMPASTIRSQWVDYQGHKSYLFYILGPIDESMVAKLPVSENGEAIIITEEMKVQREAQKLDNITTFFGKVEADAIAISQLHQHVCDLADKMIQSEKLSAACNERDRIGYQQLFDEAITKLGGFFKPPILSEEDVGKDVNVLALVKENMPALSIANVKKLAEILRKETGCNQLDINYCAIFRKFHRIRYAM